MRTFTKYDERCEKMIDKMNKSTVSNLVARKQNGEKMIK